MNQDNDDKRPWKENAFLIWDDYKELRRQLDATGKLNLFLAISIAVETTQFIIETMTGQTKWTQ